MVNLQRDMILYHIKNHKLGGSGEVVAAAFCQSPLNHLHSSELRDFCLYYLRAYWLKHVKKPFKPNDFEFFVNEKMGSISMYHHKSGYKINYHEGKDLTRIATLHLDRVPSDSDYQHWCELTGDEYATLYKIWK